MTLGDFSPLGVSFGVRLLASSCLSMDGCTLMFFSARLWELKFFCFCSFLSHSPIYFLTPPLATSSERVVLAAVTAAEEKKRRRRVAFAA